VQPVAPAWHFAAPLPARLMSDNIKKILLIDDDAEIIESMKIALEANGYTVLLARDGNAGLEMVEKVQPDLLITDMMMPKRSGFLVLENLRTSDDSQKSVMKIIMVTANEGNRHKAYAEQLGVDDYIRKPFAMDRLLESVKKLIGPAKG
jgi:DNA-binding response OmpR family regulator